MIFNREPWTDWVIKVNEDKNKEYKEVQRNNFHFFEAVYRTGFKHGKECEIFSLLPKEKFGVDFCFLQVRLFEDGNAEVENYVPFLVSVDSEKKVVTIEQHCYIEITPDRKIITSLLYEDEAFV